MTKNCCTLLRRASSSSTVVSAVSSKALTRTSLKRLAGLLKRSRAAVSSTPRTKEDRRARADYIAERSKVIKPLEKETARLEAEIAKAEALGGELEAKLVAASESGDGNAITSIAKDMDENKKLTEELYAAWEKASAELEAAKDKYKLKASAELEAAKDKYKLD